MLIVSIIAPIFMAILFGYGLPRLSILITKQFGFDLLAYKDLLTIVLLLTVPVMQGLFAAFIILDEQDEDILTFVSITPLSKDGYLLYRLGAPVVINSLLSFVALFIAGYQDVITWSFLPIMLLLALKAPLVALFVAGMAKNKVEGLAVSKVASILLLVPFAFYFVDGGLKYFAGILPPFWTVAAFFYSLESAYLAYWLHIVMAVVTHMILIYFLYHRFKKTV